jgi:Acetoacetate decarboxylase (ADC)
MSAEPAGPFIWTNARVLAVEVHVAEDAARSLLPAALHLPDPATATLFVADYPETQFGSVYREAAVLLHVEDATGPTLHCPWMVVDDDTALILGREVLGFPKKMAEIRLDALEGGLVGTVRRRGTEIMRLEATLHEAETTPEPFFARRMVNVIGTPSSGMRLIELAPGAEVIHSARRAEARVTLTSSERDPLGELQAVPTGWARAVDLDFGAVGGPPAQTVGEVDADWIARRFFARAL